MTINHTKDSDCTLRNDNSTCEICGVLFGDPCPDCWGFGFHRQGCKHHILEGYAAIEYVERQCDRGEAESRLSMYTTPIAEARDDLTIDEAREVAAEDPGLIYLDRMNIAVSA